MRRPRRSAHGAALIAFVPTASAAHSFDSPYILPIPLWMYVYGCAAVLIVTFALVGFFAGAPAGEAKVQMRKAETRGRTGSVPRPAVRLLRVGAASCLLLTIIAGMIGNQDPAANIGVTLFWVIFLLGFTYVTLLFGDLYALINPWKWTIAGLERTGFDLTSKRIGYPPRWSYWPAFVQYLVLVWLELFVSPRPASLSTALIIYSALVLAGVVAFGKTTWFDHADAFSVFFRLIGKLAPVEYTHRDADWHARLRPPFLGALSESPAHLSAVFFVLLILSATTYDAIHDTVWWIGLFWHNLLWLLQPLWGSDLGKAQELLIGWYLAYRQASLVAFPFLYFGFYALMLLWAKALLRTNIPLRTLALDFCYSLIPIAIAYHFAHYYTFLLTQIRSLPKLLADPLGRGWDVFGIDRNAVPTALNMNLVWHTEVAVLLLGHVVSVYLAHRVAMRTFASRRHVMVSQLPLLALMVAYTTLGLWILSLPLGPS